MAPRGGYNSEPDGLDLVSGADAISFVRLLLARLQGSEKEIFLNGLCDIASTEELPDSDTLNNNLEALDQYEQQSDTLSRRVETTPAMTRRDPQAQDRRRQAQDSATRSSVRSLNQTAFDRRWGGLTSHIKGAGYGRY